MGSLGYVDSRDLNNFHTDHLQPNKEFLQKARRAINSICEFLKASCFQDDSWSGVKVLKVVKGGSLGKGTSMKSGSDADLVLFLNIVRSFTDQEKKRKDIIEEIERRLYECKELLNLEVFFEKSKWLNPRVLSFKLRSKESDDFIEFDVLPAYDALGQYQRSRPNPQMYVDLICTGKSGEFSSCFTELQKDFIVDRPTKLKSLIRLVKYWYNEVQEKPLPLKYALELLTVYAWEQGSEKDKFNTAEGFRTVLWLIEHYKEIRIYWTKYYNFDNEVIKWYLQAQLRKNRPVILDPADPTANFGEEKGWDQLARKAKSYASMNCCRKRDGSFIQPWNVPTDSACCQKFNPDQLKFESALRPSEANSAHCQMFDPDWYKVDSSFHPSMPNFLGADQREGASSSCSSLPLQPPFSSPFSALQALPAPPSFSCPGNETALKEEKRKTREQLSFSGELRWKSAALAMESLSQVGSWSLDKFHFDDLQPNEEFLRKARRAINSICEFLKESCFQDDSWSGVKVLKVVKGGSLGKGTSMKSGSDANLVLFLNIVRSFTDQEKKRKMIIDEIERQLNEWQKKSLNLEVFFEKSKWLNPGVLSFKLRSKESDDFIEFDVLPAYDALGQYQWSRPNPQIYVDLIGTGKSGEFSSCFTELQKDFIVDRPTKLKSLIRLVKYWYKELKEKPLPPKYALELLTVYAWEEGSGQDKFDMAEGFRTVLWLIEHYKEIRIYWTKYYNFDNEVIKQYLQDQLCKNRPVILDPADPTANFGEAKGWDQLAEKAKSYAAMNCCRKRDGSFIQPWNVPTDSACCQKFNPDRLKFESAFRSSEANSAHCQMFDPDQYKVDSSFHPSEANSAHCQMFDPDRYKVDSSFHPSELAKEVPQEESWCTLL